MANAAAECAGCNAPGPTMQCPKCKELSLRPSYFCDQACFKKSWAAHKIKHTTEKPVGSISTMTVAERTMFNFRGTLRPALITPKRFVPKTIPRPDYADEVDGRSAEEEAERGTRVVKWAGADLAQIKRACALSREILDLGTAAAKPGVTTDEIDRVVHEATVERNMYPSPMNYYNFPKSVCTSVNEIICHGIPDARELQQGDIVNIDVSSFLAGFHGDLNETVFVGKPDADNIRLVHCAYDCLQAGIATVKSGNLYKHIGDAIEARAKIYDCSVVRTYSGHGIGRLFHTSPSVPHYANNKAQGVMAVGHVFTIEPMVNLGQWQDVTWPDKWTSSTTDGKRSAQFEHTMVVTDGGVELLTDWKDSIPTYRKQLDAWGLSVPE
jgi:methionyl aminopeptidase